MNAPLLKNGLFVKRPLSNAILRFLTWICRAEKTTVAIPSQPKKILLCNIAHFGDVVIATTVLPVLKKRYPNCEIGFMVSSAAAPLLKDHRFVSQIHCFDHLYLHRHLSRCKADLHGIKDTQKSKRFLGVCIAALQHFRSWRRTLKELRAAHYDLSIDLYPYFPNSIPLLAKSQIPIRIGYPTGGFCHLLTHPIDWIFSNDYIGRAHLHLLTPLGIDPSQENPLPCYSYKQRSSPHIVIHMGSLNPDKEWDRSKWISLIHRLRADGHQIILSGKGAREGAICHEVALQTSTEDWSNRLNWAEFVTMIQQASLLLSVDSVAVHIAAASATPTLVIFTPHSRPQMWAPPSLFCQYLAHDSDAESVYQAIDKALGENGTKNREK